MLSKLKVYHIALVLLLMVTAVAITGCRVYPPTHPAPSYQRPAITTDGSGGAIVFYATQKGELGPCPWDFMCGRRRFYVQRIDGGGNFLWGEGVLVGKGKSVNAVGLEIVADGYGGAILVWQTIPKEREPWYVKMVSVARVSPQGEIVWKREFRDEIALAPGVVRGHLLVASDGSGGVVIGWPDWQYRHLRVQRIDSQGNLLWGEDGLTLSEEPLRKGRGIYDVVVVEEGAVIFIWTEQDRTVFVQKISPEGEVLWGEGGVLAGTESRMGSRVIGDGEGGAIITWIWRVYVYEYEYRFPQWEVRAQRIDAQGNLLWQEGGISVFPSNGVGLCFRVGPWIVSDGAGGAIITHQAVGFIRGQRIDPKGNLQWQPAGVHIFSTTSLGHPDHYTVSDNSGGAIVAVQRWGEKYRKYGFSVLDAQRIDGEGKLLWPRTGVRITTSAGRYFSLLSDGQGGFFAGWIVRHMGPLLACVQRVTADGKPLWGDEGILLNP